jgi:hypothetical protein
MEQTFCDFISETWSQLGAMSTAVNQWVGFQLGISFLGFQTWIFSTFYFISTANVFFCDPQLSSPETVN